MNCRAIFVLLFLTMFLPSWAIAQMVPNNAGRQPAPPPVAAAPAVPTAPISSASPQGAEYTLDAGDKVRVIVFGEEDLSGEFQVDGAGLLALPLIGEVAIKGMTLRQAARLVETRYGTGYLRDPKVSIEVLNYRPFFIIGEVNSPGDYPYVNGMTILSAVALAGGFTYRARQDDMVLLRAGDPNRSEQRVTPETLVQPGDTIRVLERFF